MSTARFETVEVSPAIPATEETPAVTKQVQIITVDEDTAFLLNANKPLRWYVSALGFGTLFFVGWVFFGLDPFGWLQGPCEIYYHGECDDGRGFGSLVVTLLLTAMIIVPLVVAWSRIHDLREQLLKSHGWDGEAEYRLNIIKSSDDSED